MLKIFKYLKRSEWLMAGISLIFIVIQVWLDLQIPGYMEIITMLVQTPGSRLNDIWTAGGFMLLCAFGSLVGAVAVGFLSARISASFSQRLRGMMFNKVESFSMEDINRFSTSSLITRSTNDITQVQMLVTMSLQLVVKAPIMAVWAITKIAGKGFEWTMATAAAVVFMLLASSILIAFVYPKFIKMQTLTDNLTRVARENLTGLRVVRAYNAESYQEDKFETVNKDFTGVQLFTNRAMVVFMQIMTILMNALSLSIYWIGAHMIDAAGESAKLVIFSGMIVFSQYAMQVIMSFMMLVIIIVILPRAGVSAKRINEVLDTEPSIIDGGLDEGDLERAGEVEFRHVGFKYPGAAERVLEDINFKAKRGETIAFIGSTGSGKSTIVNLILRFYDASEGDVFVSGLNVKQYKLNALYDKIGYAPQKAVLFKGTVESNVAYGETGAPYTRAERVIPGDPESLAERNTGGEPEPLAERDSRDEPHPAAEDDLNNVNHNVNNDVKNAILIAQGTDFVEDMEGGYGAAIAREGGNVSGGQKQRLAIARAIYRKPEIYIFDDSFSALDFKTDRALRAELKKATAGVTTIIVAQRIGTIMDADQIIVLDEGRIAGTGRHAELLRDCPVYREIAISQLGEEETAS